MKKIIFILIALLAINTQAQEIHSKDYYSKYKKKIKKLESFLTEQGFSKSKHNILYRKRSGSYNYVFTKGETKIFVIIPHNKRWIDAADGVEALSDYHYLDYFKNKLKTLSNYHNENEIYLIKQN
jgi:hypothetical protein